MNTTTQTYLTEEQKAWPLGTYQKEQIVKCVLSVADPTTKNRLYLLMLFQYMCVYCEAATW